MSSEEIKELNSYDIFNISLKMWIIFLIGHFSVGFYIMYKDLNGSWDIYKLSQNLKSKINKNKNKNDYNDYDSDRKNMNNKLYKYSLCINYLIRDFLIIMPIFLYLYVYYTSDFITKNLDIYNLYIEIFIKIPIGYLIECIWDYFVHRAWHQVPYLYKYVHKSHHIPEEEMCSLSAWRDSITEFILEIPGTFLIGPFFMKMNWISHSIMLFKTGFMASIDHSGFYVNFLFDSRYHYDHHLRPNGNFADLEFLDNFFKTNLY
jgi:sterol desaturase/sphingolipid hydroxylase (fatty acid hydroxylase superfamily)